MYSLKILKDLGVKIVVTPYYHGTGHTFFRRFLWIFWRRYVKDMLRNCIVHTVSKFEADIVKRDFRVKAIPIENGVEEWIRDLRWDPKNYVFYSGRIERYKNIDLLAKIVKILNKRYGLDLMLKIFGKGSYKEILERSLKYLGIYYEVNDFRPFEEYIKYLSHAVFFGLLSEKESYPQSVNEANAIGVPAVVVKPWGLNFGDRRRTLIINLRKDLDALADEIYTFLRKTSEEDKSLVPTWSEITQEYIKKLYSDQI
jgi:glycosyltransferase involved in cell wall biosynthesis